MSARELDLGQLRLDLGRCPYVEDCGLASERACILRAEHPGRHVLLSMGYTARPIATVRVRGEVL